MSGFGPNKQTEDDKHLVGKVSRASATTKKNSFYIQLVGNLVTFHRVSYSKYFLFSYLIPDWSNSYKTVHNPN